MATTLVVHLDIVPERFAEFLDFARGHAERSKTNEDGCLDFQIHLPREVASQVILVETYRDDDALQAHLDSAHMAAYLEATGPMVAKRQRAVCDH